MPAVNAPRASRARIGAAALATTGLWVWDLSAERFTLAAAALTVLWWCARELLPARAVAVFLLTSPLVTVPLRAVTSTAVEYFEGTATLARASWGRPPAGRANLDPTYRAFPRGGACVPDAGWLARAGIRRVTFIALFRTLGPMRGAYQGPYPTPQDARKLIDAASLEVDPKGWTAGELHFGQQRIRVSSNWRDRIGRSPVRRISAALAGDCAVFLIESPRGETLSLVDLQGFGWFATFVNPPAGS